MAKWIEVGLADKRTRTEQKEGGVQKNNDWNDFQKKYRNELRGKTMQEKRIMYYLEQGRDEDAKRVERGEKPQRKKREGRAPVAIRHHEGQEIQEEQERVIGDFIRMLGSSAEEEKQKQDGHRIGSNSRESGDHDGINEDKDNPRGQQENRLVEVDAVRSDEEWSIVGELETRSGPSCPAGRQSKHEGAGRLQIDDKRTVMHLEDSASVEVNLRGNGGNREMTHGRDWRSGAVSTWDSMGQRRHLQHDGHDYLSVGQHRKDYADEPNTQDQERHRTKRADNDARMKDTREKTREESRRRRTTGSKTRRRRDTTTTMTCRGDDDKTRRRRDPTTTTVTTWQGGVDEEVDENGLRRRS